MRSPEFVRAYDATNDQTTWRQDEFSDYLRPAREWSQLAGEHLHHYLATKRPLKPAETKELMGYTKWAEEQGTRIADAIEADHPEESPQKRHALMELHFTHLNLDMFQMWRPILGNEWQSPREREQDIKQAMAKVALRATTRFNLREELASPVHKFQYFSPELRPLRQYTSATLAEDDFALVGLKMMLKHPDITVVPAPMQFENSAKKINRRSPKVDAVMMRNTSDELYAVGAQVKSRRHDGDEQRYDPSRVVIVDGCDDMDGMMERQVNERGYIRMESWPGLLCAHELIAQKPQTHRLASDIGRQALIRHFRAKTSVRDIHHSIDYAVHRVSRQLLPHLGHNMPHFVRPSLSRSIIDLAG